MDRSIVCGVDGSSDSQAALAVAVDLAARLGLRLIMLRFGAGQAERSDLTAS